jgi:hypothetical membrane protein
MERINKFYYKVNGSIFYFIGVAISIISIVTSIILYTAGGASYSILANFVSDLGATTAPNNAFIAFNMGLIINSIISPFGTLFLALFFLDNDNIKKWIVWFWILINIISSIATFLVALFPEDIMIGPHIVAAIITFFFGMLSYVIYGFIVIFAEKIGKYHSIPGFSLAVISIIFILSWVFRINISIITVLEWIVLFSGWAFGINLGIISLKYRRDIK